MLRNGRNCSRGNKTHFLLLPLSLSAASSGVRPQRHFHGEPQGGAPDVGGRGALYPESDGPTGSRQAEVRHQTLRS